LGHIAEIGIGPNWHPTGTRRRFRKRGARRNQSRITAGTGDIDNFGAVRA